MPEVEEYFDLLFYRPLAFACVRLIGRTGITPNQITLLSVIFGLFAARMYAYGGPGNFQTAAILYAAANILDCADGQLARLKNNGTLLGRVLDGAADYVSSIAIFLGLGFGLSTGHEGIWILVVCAGISSAVHAMFFDHYQSEFVSAVRSERNFLERETERFTLEEKNLRAQGGNRLKIFILSLYIRYLDIQRRASTKKQGRNTDPQLYRGKNIRMIRCWSLLGPTTNRTILIAASLFGRPGLYLWIVLVFGNLWLLCCYLLQRRVHRSLASAVDIP